MGYKEKYNYWLNSDEIDIVIKEELRNIFTAPIMNRFNNIIGFNEIKRKDAEQICKNIILKGIGRVYVDLIRGTPMLLQLSFIYLGVPMIYQMITGNYLGMDALAVGILGIGINSGAYVCELIRGAINSIDKGQWEAGKSLGLTQSQILMKIILPQSFKRIIPPLANEFIVLIKDSSLVSTIGVYDLMQTSNILGGKYYNYFVPMIGAALVYLVLTLVISHFTMKLEKRLAESD